MSITKPYTFQPNTKARANEVNANFDTLYSQANTNISNIEANARDIDELNDTKAELNGDSTQRFAVADPVNDTDAINKQTMLGQLAPTIDYIGGLTITKDSSSPNDTIIVSSGSCYDSTKKVVLSLANSTSKKNATQAASATYYIHIIGNATGSSTNIIISNDSISPTLPSGYTLYRLIGFYTTNGNGNINLIYNYSNSLGVKEISNYLMPDYSKGINVLAGNFTPTTNGILSGYLNVDANNGFSVSLNGDVLFRCASSSSWENKKGFIFPLCKNETYVLGGGNWVCKFYPLKGDS